MQEVDEQEGVPWALRPPGLGLLLWEGEEPGEGLEGRAGEGMQLTPISEAAGLRSRKGRCRAAPGGGA